MEVSFQTVQINPISLNIYLEEYHFTHLIDYVVPTVCRSDESFGLPIPKLINLHYLLSGLNNFSVFLSVFIYIVFKHYFLKLSLCHFKVQILVKMIFFYNCIYEFSCMENHLKLNSPNRYL